MSCLDIMDLDWQVCFGTIFTLLYVRNYYAKLGLASRKVFSDAGHADGPSGR